MSTGKDMKALNDALHRQLNRLGDPELDNKKIELELQRTSAITSVSKQIIENAKVMLEATKIAETQTAYSRLPKILKETTTA